MFRLFVAIGVLVVTALFTALIAPYFIDWTAHKQRFEQQASVIFGQPVKVGGVASLRILPLPSINFGDMVVGENSDGTPLLSVGKFSAKLELLPFLSGKVRVVDMILDNPVLNLQVDENGSVEWTNRKNTLVGPDQVALNKVSIRDAKISITGLAGRNFYADAINGEMSAKSLFGPWKLNARGNVEGVDTVFDIATGRLQDEGGIRLKLTAQRTDQPYKMFLDGSVGVEDEVLSWNGKFKFLPSVQKNSKIKSAKVALPVKTEGVFLLTSAAIKVPQFRTEIGDKGDPFVLNGSGGSSLKEAVYFKFKIDGRQINLDRVAEMRGEGATVGKQRTLEDRIRIVRDVLEQIPVPTIKGEVDFKVPAIVAGDSIIREVSALIKPFGKGWEIRKMHAKLPGSSTVEAEGRLRLKEDFGFSGHLVVASKQPSGFASWAIGRVDPAIRRLSSGGLEADVTFTQSQASFENMTLLLGENKLVGSIKRIAAPVLDKLDDENKTNNRAAIIATLNGDEIRLEDLEAVLALSGNSVATDFSEHDLDVSLKAKHLEAFDVAAKGVDLQFQLNSGELSIGKLNAASFYGAKITSVGQITNLLSAPKGHIKFGLASNNAMPLIIFLEKKLGNNVVLAALKSDLAFTRNTDLVLEIDATPSGDGSRGRALVDGEIGGTSVNAQLGFDAKLSDVNAAKLDLTVNLVNKNPKILLSQTALLQSKPDLIAAQLREGLTGPLNMAIESVGSINAGLSTLLSASTLNASVSANGLYSPYAKNGANTELDVTLGFEDVEPYLLEYGYGVSNSILEVSEKIPFSATFRYRQENQNQKFSNISATIAGNAVAGELNLSRGRSGRPTLKGELAFDVLSVPKVVNFVFGKNGLQGELSTNVWSESEFGTPLFLGHDGELEVTAANIITGSNINAKNARISVAVRNGDINLKNIVAETMGGTFGGNVSLQNADGTGVLTAQFLTEGVDAETLFSNMSAPNFVSGKLRINGAIEASGKSPKALISALSGSGVVTLDKGRLANLNVGGLDSVLEISGEDGFVIDADHVDPLAQKAFLSGELVVEQETAAFSIARGVMQIRNLIREGEGWETAFSGQVSLLDSSTHADAKLSVDAGKNHVVGVSPEVSFSWDGPIDKLIKTVDSQALQGFLSVRALEAEERRVELLQASILEKKRLRFEILKTKTRFQFRELKRQEAKAIEQARIAKEKRLADEAEKIRLAKKAKEARAIKVEKERVAKVAKKAAIVAKQKAAIAAKKEKAKRAKEVTKKNDEIQILKPIKVPTEKSTIKKKLRPPVAAPNGETRSSSKINSGDGGDSIAKKIESLLFPKAAF